MRPLKLTLRAFGPFAETQTIDFRPAVASRLFGIYGPTGAGKTSILDGLCYALFGESSGQERQGDDLRSHHATPDVDTEAQLIFEVGPKRYHVIRRPRQTVRSRRGEALVERQHWAALYDATDLEVDAITPEKPGLVLEERKVEVVADRLRAILNYSAAQFRQVVLLPQGQFRQLLTASSDQRSAVLRGLFDVSLFERLVDRLKAEAAALRDTVTEGRQQIEAHLLAHEIEDAEALARAIGTTRADASAGMQAQAAAVSRRDAARGALQAGQAVAALFTEYDASVLALAEVTGRQAEIDTLALRQAAAQRAQQCLADDDRAVEAALAWTTGVTAVATAQADIENLAAASHAAAARLAQSAAQQPDRDAAAARVTQLEGLGTRVAAASALRDAVGHSATVRRSARAKLEAAEAAHREAEESVTVAEARRLGVQTQALRKAALDVEVAGLRQARDLATAHQSATAALNRLTSDREAAQTQLATLRGALEAARAAESAAETSLAAAQAVHLAQSLVDGEACPVCGATDHPAPAEGREGEATLEQTRRDARAARERSDLAERAGAEAAARAEGEWAQARDRLAQLAPPTRDLAALEADIDAVETELAIVRADGDVTGATQAFEAARAALTVTAASLASARQAFVDCDRRAATDAAALDGALADVPPELRDPVAITTQSQAAVAARDTAVAAHQSAVAAERAAAEALSVAQAKFNFAEIRELELRAAKTRHADALQAALIAAGLEGDAFLAAKLDIADLEALATQLRAHADALAAARDRRDRAATAVLDLERPGLAAAEAAVATADFALATIEQTLTATNLRLAQLEAAQARIVALEASLAEATERYRVLGELATLSDGRNAHRLRLRDFAIAATFDLVLEAANLRFALMSRGRFALLRKFEGGDGRARAGLDIEVYDGHTDQKRDAHTLSGGEGFLASLSLALGLSDVVQAEAGGVKLDAIFIDEGFGHLDDETLDIALDTLRDLVGQDRAVGVISHVESVKQQIPAGFDVVRTLRGSTVAARRGA